jgi:two-component system chemotaxis response regulator CheY
MNRFTVLVVEDHADMQWLETAVLQNAGIETMLACDGVEALELLRSQPPPDAIVTDIDMPRMNGHQLIAALAEIPALRGIPIVVASSRTDVEPRVSGVFASITRPFNAERFASTVTEACRVGREWKHRRATALRAIDSVRSGIDDVRRRLGLHALAEADVETMASGLVRVGRESGDDELLAVLMTLLDIIVGRDA